LWNERDESVSWWPTSARPCGGRFTRAVAVGQDFTPVLASGPFVNIERRKFSHHQILDHEGFFQRVLNDELHHGVSVRDEEQRTVMRDVQVVVDTADTITFALRHDVYARPTVAIDGRKMIDGSTYGETQRFHRHRFENERVASVRDETRLWASS